MKVNFSVELIDKKAGGIYNAAMGFKKHLRQHGIETRLNSKKDYDILHVQTLGPTSFRMILNAKKESKPVVIHAHTTHLDFRDSFTFSNKLSLPLRLYLKYFYNLADIILTPSEYTKNILKRIGVKKPIKVISNGVDNEKFKRQNSNDKKIVYMVGHVFLKKGVKTFVEVARSNPDYRFIWYGNHYNPLLVNYSKIKNIIDSKPQNVVFKGFVDDITKAHNNGSVFMFPSFNENQGIAILEAAACGKPIVVRDIPVFNDWLKHRENCFKANNDNEFSHYVKLLLENKKLRSKLGNKARKLAEENDIRKVTKELVKIYEELT